MRKNFSLFLSVIISLFFFSATSRVFADASAQLQQAEEYLKNNQYEQAEQVYKQIIAENPGTNDALQAQEKLTCLYVTQGKETEAQSGLQKLLTDFSQYNGTTTAVTHVADEYRNLGRHQKAIEIYQQVVAKWPGDEHAMWSQMGIAISNASIGSDSATEAAYAKLCADYSGQQHISRAVCLVSDNYRRLGKHKKAQDIYRYALGLPSAKPDAEFTLWSQMGLAISSLNLGDEVAASQAIEKLRADFDKDNRISIAICQIADEYRKFGRHSEACELYQYVVGNHPNAEHALWSQMGLAISNICLGDEDAAQKAVDRLRADFGQDKRMATAACMVADEYRNFRKHEKACELYQYIVNTWPGNEQTIWSLRGMALSRIALEDNDKTEAIIKTLLAQYSGNKNIAEVVYQIASRLKKLTNNIDADDSIIFDYNDYDKVGNRLSYKIDDANEQVYIYDKLYQLTFVDYNDGNTTDFDYDKLGNRTSVVNGGTKVYLSNKLNQYTSVGGAAYTYDNNGNLTNDGTRSYVYDCENRLISSTNPIRWYRYDYLGRRVRKMIGTNIKYCYDGDQVIAEYNNYNTLQRKYVYGPGIDEPICMIDVAGGNAVYYYHFDGLGSVAALSNIVGDTVERYSYSVFGEPNRVSGENDLRRVLLSVITPKPTDKAHLSLGPEGEPQMQVWSKADRQGLLLSIKDGPTYVEWPSGNVPTEVYIEASSYSGPVDDKSLWLTYTGVDYNTIPTSVYPVDRDPQAKIYFTCVELDMDMDGVNDDYYGLSLEKTDETVPGGFVPFNDDDDNHNSVLDKDENGPVAGENDLIELKLFPVLPEDQEHLPIDNDHPVTLKAIAGGSRIKIWESQTKGGSPLTLPIEYRSRYGWTQNDPKILWVEGFQPSVAVRDITLALQYSIFEDRIKVTVTDVDITEPDGSLDAGRNPISSWENSPCYHFDFQGIRQNQPGSYALTISGEISPASVFAYQWSLPSSCGTLNDYTIPSPTHTPPTSTGEGIMQLEALYNGTPTGVIETRKVQIYQDHLSRDHVNFGTGTYHYGTWEVTAFNVDPHPTMGTWNCHGSTWHHWNGSGTGNRSTLPPVGSPKKTVVVSHQAGGGGTHPPLGTLNRGDIVAYYQADGPLMHSQTCMGNGTETYGANNEPLPYPGAPSDQSWKWATSTAGDWANNLWLPGTGIMPVTIKVYDKPNP